MKKKKNRKIQNGIHFRSLSSSSDDSNGDNSDIRFG